MSDGAMNLDHRLIVNDRSIVDVLRFAIPDYRSAMTRVF